MTSPSITQALADMREGLRVLVVSADRNALLALWTEAGAAKVDGEHERRNVGHERIDRDAGGEIRFAVYAHARAHLLTMPVGSLIFDHTAVLAAAEHLSPGMAVTHYPAS